MNGGTADDPIFEPVFQSTRDEEGIHSHQDGVIHIHPFFDRTAGRNAQVQAFMREMGAEISEEAIVMPGGIELGIEEERTIVDDEGNPILDEDGNVQTETVPVEVRRRSSDHPSRPLASLFPAEQRPGDLHRKP